jgi:uncharacterized protein
VNDHVNDRVADVKSWNYWATVAWTIVWAIVAFAVGQIGGLASVVFWRSGRLYEVLSTPFDGISVALFVLISNPLTIAVVWLAVWLAKVDPIDHLALRWPAKRDVAIGLVMLVGLIALSDALLYLSGRDLVTPFQLQSYTTAQAEGWLPALLFAAIVAAPAGEEVLFRGFLFQGFVRSERFAWLWIVIISLLWAALHIQYDWAGMVQIFVIGLFLGWMRWRSGSLLLTFFLHALFNLEGTLETVLQVKFFS